MGGGGMQVLVPAWPSSPLLPLQMPLVQPADSVHSHTYLSALSLQPQHACSP